MVHSVEKIIEDKDMSRCDLVVQAYRPLILSSMKKYFNKYYLFEDLYQEGVLQVCQGILDYDKDMNIPFKAYISSRLRYFYLGLNRDRKYRTDLSLDYEDEESGSSLMDLLVGDTDIEKLYEDKETYYDLVDALGKLSCRQRQIIIDFYIRGKAIRDIAEDMDIACRTCYNLKTMGMKNLRKFLKV